MTIVIRGEPFELLPERCLFWPAHRLLVVADLHLGKSETFQQSGLCLPSQSHRADLTALTRAIHRTQATRLLFLGDLVHAVAGVTEAVRRQFARWLDSFHGEVAVVLGNHDAGLAKRWPREWTRAVRHPRVMIDAVGFQHEPVSRRRAGGPFLWVGHVHPMIALKRGPDRLRLPGFVISRSQGMLPAFSSVSGGSDMRLTPRLRAFVVGDGQVYEV